MADMKLFMDYGALQSWMNHNCKTCKAFRKGGGDPEDPHWCRTPFALQADVAKGVPHNVCTIDAIFAISPIIQVDPVTPPPARCKRYRYRAGRPANTLQCEGN